MFLKKNHLFIVSIFYLYLPIFIFLLMWTKILVSLPITLITILALYIGIKKLILNISSKILIDIKEIVFSFFVILFICVFCGGGGLFVQDYDYSKHNTIINDLVNYDWPVIYKNDSMLTYYLGQYVVPGFIGHVFNSVKIGIWSQVIWNAFGLLISFYLICYFVNADTGLKRVGVGIIIFIFGGAIILGSSVYEALNGVKYSFFKWLDISRVKVHFASNFDSIRGAFQHIIVPWISCGIFISDENYNKTNIYYLLLFPLMFSATFGFIYFALIILAVFIYNCFINSFKTEFNNILSFSNIGLIPVTLVFLVYLAGNFLGDKPPGIGFKLIDFSDMWDFLIIFVFTEFLLYFITIYKTQKKNPIFYIILVELLIIPFISLGMYNDLCSRGANPARFILMTYCIKQLYEYKIKYIWNKLLVLILLIAALNTVSECKYVVKTSYACEFKTERMTAKKFTTFEGMSANPDIRQDEAYNYFTLNYSSSLFEKIAR